ncbi:hypothetical protein FA95DRAFT_1606380 [Auriscalpium vulgare]|uniref:Uncharacterized protein n=1 Tax=Auriscalpium vulgare TaxID=40419 RepID=A0ACB8RSV5_9AGAM|nr:hypothetical protein FA95DRAFT_1606380 [Auriscalpium vulgare]
MLSTQSPVALPRIHVLYTDLPATSRRAANMPFLAARAAPASLSSPVLSSNNALGLSLGPMPTRRAPPPPPRRNAISYHPSQPASQNPFADQNCCSVPSAPPPAPRPRSRAVLISSGHLTTPPSVAYYAQHSARLPPPPPPRDYPAKVVASMLLNRSGRARPTRDGRRPPGARNAGGYVRSGLSTCVAADEVEGAAGWAQDEGDGEAWADELVRSLADVE